MEPKPHETDPKRQKRQAAAKLAREALTEDWLEDLPARSVAQVALEIDSMLAHWIKATTTVLDAAQEDPAPLIAHARQFVMMRALVDRTRPLRPSVALHAVLSELVNEAASVLHIYLDAISADDLRRVQELGNQAQDAIDRCLVLYQRMGDLYREVHGSTLPAGPDDVMRELAARAVAHTGATNIVSNAAHAQPIFKEITGSDEGFDPVLGPWLLVNSTNFATNGDHKRFIKVAQEAYKILMKDTRGVELVRSGQWRDDMRHAATKSFDGGASAMAVLSSATSDRVRVDALLELAHALVETIGRPHAATIRHLNHKSTYPQVKMKDAAEVLSAIADKFGHLTVGLSGDLRHAKAHSTYQLGGDGVDIFARDGHLKGHLSGDELVDTVLAGHESVVAMSAGFLCAVTTMGEALEAVLPPPDVIPWRTNVIGVLELHGWTGVAVENGDPAEVLVSGTPPLTPRSAQGLYMITGYLPASVETVRAVSADGNSELIAPVAAMPIPVNDEDEKLRTIRYVQAMRAARLNGKPCIGDALFRKWMACRVGETADDDFATRMKRLRLLVQVAKGDGDEELAKCVRATMAACRTRAIQIGAISSEDSARIQTLANYTRVDVDSSWLDTAG